MPIPQVTDRIKEAPAVVLRAVFAGIGQLLMAVDKIRAQSQEHPASPAPAGQDGTGPAQSAQQPTNGAGNVTQLRERPAPAAANAGTAGARPAATKPAAHKPAAKPATARRSTATPKPAARPKPAATTKPATTTKPAAATKPAATSKPTATTTKPAAAKPDAAPIPGYDDLSVPSLRARLRGLDADGVQALLAYEKTHAQRDDVITMYERRLSKIADGTG